MTRKHLRRVLFRNFLFFTLVLVGAMVCKLSDLKVLNSAYEFIRDMSLIFVTLAAAYLANVFQKRSNFLQSLREEWREIVDTKSTLIAYCEDPDASAKDFIDTSKHISRTIDYMRIVYKNIGETKKYIGRYPYEPLHDMRKALESIDPRRKNDISFQEKQMVKDEIIQLFQALRENFLEEFDLPEPSSPVLEKNSRRKKTNGHKK